MLHLALVVHYISELIIGELSRLITTRTDRDDRPPDDRPPDDRPPDDIRPSARRCSAFEDNYSSEESCDCSTPETETPEPESGSECPIEIGQPSSDPEGVFGRLFRDDGSFDVDFLRAKLRGRTLAEVVRWHDVDGYDLLEKAVLYNSRTLVRLLLTVGDPERSTPSGSRRPATDSLGGAVRLAAFLGCVDIVAELLRYDPSVAGLRGPIRVRPVRGPPNDLFRIIGYGRSTRNPRLAFQMAWLRAHPNELPVHYAVCAGYPIIVDMLTSRRPPSTPEPEADESWPPDGCRRPEDPEESTIPGSDDEDALLTSLVRQAASCASYDCLEALYGQIPGAMYARDRRGWLFVASGLPHGLRFVRFLVERGFAVKLLNNIDGRATVNALHVYYGALSRPDGIAAKFTDLYDVTELLLDLSVDVNMETTAFRSHGVVDTALHLLVDQVNLILASVLGDGEVTGRGRYVVDDDDDDDDVRFLSDAQDVYDASVREAVRLLLASGFDLERHCLGLLKRLFVNRNWARRYGLSARYRHLAAAGYGLGHVYDVARIMLRSGDVRLPAVRRQITPTLTLIDSLRDADAVLASLGARSTAGLFADCLRLLHACGDDLNAYPASGRQDSYMANPLVHLVDLYVGHWCRSVVRAELARTVEQFGLVVRTLCQSGARFVCRMCWRGGLFRHGVYDSVRRLFVIVHRQLCEADQSTNSERLRVVNVLSASLVQYGAEPVIEEYAFRKGQLPVSRKDVESKLLGQILLLGLYAVVHEAGHGLALVDDRQYQMALNFHLNLANHGAYYACLNYAVSLSRDLGMDLSADGCPDFSGQLKSRAENVRQLKHITRVRIYEYLKPNVSLGHEKLPLPSALLNYLFTFER